MRLIPKPAMTMVLAVVLLAMATPIVLVTAQTTSVPTAVTGGGGVPVELRDHEGRRVCSCDPDTVSMTCFGAAEVPKLGACSSLVNLTLGGGTFTAIDNDTFEGLAALRALTFDATELSALPSLAHLPSLEVLNVTRAHVKAIPANFFCVPHNLGTVDLRRNVLGALHPDAFACLADLTHLYLRQNLIDALAPSQFTGAPNLQFLDLEFNLIANITGAHFAGLNRLTTLILRNNFVTELHNGTFAPLTSLRNVTVAFNRLTAMHADALLQLGTLDELYLHHNCLTQIDANTFAPVANLTVLDLGFNFLSMLDANTFSHLPLLTELRLDNNDLRNISTGLLAPLPRLISLRLGVNYLGVLHPSVFSQQTQLRNLSLDNNRVRFEQRNADIFAPLAQLRQLVLSMNDISTLPSSLFDGLTSLRTLDLSINSLTAIDPAWWTSLSQLHTLVLDENSIGELPQNALDGLPNLELLSISDNNLSAVANNTFQRQTMLKHLGLTRNSLPYLASRTLAGLRSLETLDLFYNNISLIAEDAFATGAGARTGGAGPSSGGDSNTPLLREINLAQNALHTIPENAFRFLPDLTAVSFQNNNLTHVAPTLFQGLRGNLTLDLSDNNLQELPRFEDVTLESLNLRENEIAGMQGRVALPNQEHLRALDLSFNNELHRLIRSPKFFRALTNLRELHLNGLRWDRLPRNVFSDLTRLTVLNIQEGVLQTLRADDFSALSSLVDLDISHNNIAALPPTLLRGLHALQRFDAADNALTAFDGSQLLQDQFALRELDLAANRLDMTLAASDVAPVRNLQLLYLQRNGRLSITPDALSALAHLQVLDVSRTNDSTLVTSGQLRFLRNLEELGLAQCNVSALDEDTFRANPRLQSLDVSNNLLGPSLSAAPFQQLVLLEGLDMSNNEGLQDMLGDWDALPRLQSLIMHNSNISRVPRQLTKLLQRPTVYFSMDRNPSVCFVVISPRSQNDVLCSCAREYFGLDNCMPMRDEHVVVPALRIRREGFKLASDLIAGSELRVPASKIRRRQRQQASQSAHRNPLSSVTLNSFRLELADARVTRLQLPATWSVYEARRSRQTVKGIVAMGPDGDLRPPLDLHLRIGRFEPLIVPGIDTNGRVATSLQYTMEPSPEGTATCDKPEGLSLQYTDELGSIFSGQTLSGARLDHCRLIATDDNTGERVHYANLNLRIDPCRPDPCGTLQYCTRSDDFTSHTCRVQPAAPVIAVLLTITVAGLVWFIRRERLRKCYHVFVSYRQRTDKELAEKVVQRLQQVTLKDGSRLVCFWDQQSIFLGDNWERKFLTGLKRSCLFLPLISDAAIKPIENVSAFDEKPDNVLLEYEAALKLAKRRRIGILPLLVKDPETGGFNFDHRRFPPGPSKTCSSRPVRGTMELLFKKQGEFVDPYEGLTDEQVAKLMAFFETKVWGRNRKAGSKDDRGLFLRRHWRPDKTTDHNVQQEKQQQWQSEFVMVHKDENGMIRSISTSGGDSGLPNQGTPSTAAAVHGGARRNRAETQESWLVENESSEPAAIALTNLAQIEQGQRGQTAA